MGRFLYATFTLNSCRIVTRRWWISIIENHINPKAYKSKAKVVNLSTTGNLIICFEEATHVPLLK